MQFMGYFNTILTQNQVFSHGKQSIFHQLFFIETFVSTNCIIHLLHNLQKDSSSQPTKGFFFTTNKWILLHNLQKDSCSQTTKGLCSQTHQHYLSYVRYGRYYLSYVRYGRSFSNSTLLKMPYLMRSCSLRIVRRCRKSSSCLAWS